MTLLSLTPALDAAAAAPLRALLLAERGGDLEIDASAVTRVGGQCLQVLLSAKRTWSADGKALRLTNISDACRDALATTGAGALLGVEN